MHHKLLKHETVKIVAEDKYNKNVRRVKDYIDHQDLIITLTEATFNIV